MSDKYPEPQKECSVCHKFKVLSGFPRDHMKRGILDPLKCLSCIKKGKTKPPSRRIHIVFHQVFEHEKGPWYELFFDLNAPKPTNPPIESITACDHKVPLHFCTACRDRIGHVNPPQSYHPEQSDLCLHSIRRDQCILCPIPRLVRRTYRR